MLKIPQKKNNSTLEDTLHKNFEFLVHSELVWGLTGRLYSPAVGHQHLISKSNCVALGGSIMFVRVIGR